MFDQFNVIAECLEKYKYSVHTYTLEGINHSKNLKSVIIYLPSSCSKPV